MVVTLTIEGSHIHDIASFYNEINRVFMASEDWRLAPSLDALDDMLYGGYGALLSVEKAVIVWKDYARARETLGHGTTLEYYRRKLAQPQTFNTRLFQDKLDALENGNGQTYFEIVLEIFEQHPEISIEPD